MGATFANCHIRTNSSTTIVHNLQTLIKRRAYVLPSGFGWVAVYDETSQSQGINEIGRIARALSDECRANAIAFFIEDSDVLHYEMYDSGKLLDKYNSCPGYWGEEDPIEKKRLAVDPEILAQYCIQDTKSFVIRDLLQNKSDVLEEERLARLAQLMGIDISFSSLRHPKHSYELAQLMGIDIRLACIGFDDIESPHVKSVIGNLDNIILIDNKTHPKNENLFIVGAGKGDIKIIRELENCSAKV